MLNKENLQNEISQRIYQNKKTQMSTVTTIQIMTYKHQNIYAIICRPLYIWCKTASQEQTCHPRNDSLFTCNCLIWTVSQQHITYEYAGKNPYRSGLYCSLPPKVNKIIRIYIDMLHWRHFYLMSNYFNRDKQC